MRKTATKTRLAKVAAIFIDRTRLTCNNVSNTNKTASLSLICELWICELIVLTSTLNLCKTHQYLRIREDPNFRIIQNHLIRSQKFKYFVSTGVLFKDLHVRLLICRK